MKKVTVSIICVMIIFVVIEYEIKPKFDSDDGVLSYETIVQIFDKRQAIRGVKKLKNDFKVKRRKLLRNKSLIQYAKVVLLF
jgi:hypothetical protein